MGEASSGVPAAAAAPHGVRSVEDPARLRRSPEGFVHHLHRGRWLPPFLSLAALHQLKGSWDTDSRDILVATAQKAGTHLTKRFVVELLAEAGAFPTGHPCAQRDIGHGAMPWAEVLLSQEGVEGWQRHQRAVAAGPRLWYTHARVDDLPMRRLAPGSRVLVCLRDPRAVAVSQYHFYRRHPLLGVDPNLSLERFVELFLAGDLYFGDHFTHVRGWYEASAHQIPADSLLLVHYEALVQAKADAARRIAAFLLPGRTLPAEAIARVARRTEFGLMKAEMMSHPQTFHFRPEHFFRAGRTDDWRQQLHPDQAERILLRARQMWAGTALLEDLQP